MNKVLNTIIVLGMIVLAYLVGYSQGSEKLYTALVEQQETVSALTRLSGKNYVEFTNINGEFVKTYESKQKEK